MYVKRGLKADLPAEGQTGEVFFCTDTHELFVGMGTGNPLAAVNPADIDSSYATITYVDSQDAATLTTATAYTDSAIVAATTRTYVAGEDLAAGDFVYIKSDGLVWKASADLSGNAATGFVLASVPSGANALVYRDGLNTGLVSLTVGARYYLSDATPGGVTDTPVTGAGRLHQFLGIATSATTIDFALSEPLILAS